ncbi:hypothetical protein EVAR_31818_1 [Eumeta japonica]|uniref:Uncharacterized protein n=1 Tax=Eumeta variegata TaxID=151549 RepID=A0A4C1WLU5_EUMVA|nr:hypothetical protein EVAR_31818_1 [Eumeta japonica]
MHNEIGRGQPQCCVGSFVSKFHYVFVEKNRIVYPPPPRVKRQEIRRPGKHDPRRLYAHKESLNRGFHGRVNLSDEFRDSRLFTAMNNKNIDAVGNMNETDRHVTNHEIWAFLSIGLCRIDEFAPTAIAQYGVLNPLLVAADVTSRACGARKFVIASFITFAGGNPQINSATPFLATQSRGCRPRAQVGTWRPLAQAVETLRLNIYQPDPSHQLRLADLRFYLMLVILHESVLSCDCHKLKNCRSAVSDVRAFCKEVTPGRAPLPLADCWQSASNRNFVGDLEVARRHMQTGDRGPPRAGCRPPARRSMGAAGGRRAPGAALAPPQPPPTHEKVLLTLFYSLCLSYNSSLPPSTASRKRLSSAPANLL